jgi:polygalacturonase
MEVWQMAKIRRSVGVVIGAAIMWSATMSAVVAAPLSNGTVVVANPAGSAQLAVVGTSTIKVLAGATVAQVKAQIVAKDSSTQTYAVTDASSNPKTSGAIVTGDRLVVTAADGTDTFAYNLAVYDQNAAQAADGLYWNEATYNQIDQTVNANVPVFRNVDYVVTDPKYASLVVLDTDGIGQTKVVTGVWNYTAAIAAAIAEANANGGGRVVVPATGSMSPDGATYYSGAINILSNVNLYVATGATIKFLRNPTNDYYPLVHTAYQGSDFYNYSPLVYAYGQTNIGLTGGGTLDAQYNQGNWKLPAGVAGAPSGTNTIINNQDYAHTPITQRIFSATGAMPATIPAIAGLNTAIPGAQGPVTNVAPPAGTTVYKTTFTPQFVEFNFSSNILIQDIHVINTLFWEVHPFNSNNILIRNMTVYDLAHLTDDGIDPESCNNVVLEGNSVTVLDDGSAIKSGRNLDGRYRSPSQNIIVRNSTFFNPSGGSAGISMGSENSGSVQNVFAENNTFGGPGTAYILKIKMNAWRGNMVNNIYFRNSTVTATIRGILNLDTNYSEGSPFTQGDVFNPTIRNVFMDNVSATPAVVTTFPAIVMSSDVSRSPIENVYYRNSTFYTTATFPSAFTSLKMFKNLVIDNVTFINNTTHASTVYNTRGTAGLPGTSPLNLLNQTVAMVGSQTVPLSAACAACNPTVVDPVNINRLSGKTFAISGKVDLSTYPTFVSGGGAVKVYVDRSTTATPVTLNADGSFTSSAITLDDTQYWYVDPPEHLVLTPLPYTTASTAQYWYSDRHYIAVNFYDTGVNINTLVYQVSDRLLGDVDGDGAVTCSDLTAASAAVGKRVGQAGYMPSADMDQNGVIDIRDIAAISRLLPLGTHC